MVVGDSGVGPPPSGVREFQGLRSQNSVRDVARHTQLVEPRPSETLPKILSGLVSVMLELHSRKVSIPISSFSVFLLVVRGVGVMQSPSDGVDLDQI